LAQAQNDEAAGIPRINVRQTISENDRFRLDRIYKALGYQDGHEKLHDHTVVITNKESGDSVRFNLPRLSETKGSGILPKLTFLDMNQSEAGFSFMAKDGLESGIFVMSFIVTLDDLSLKRLNWEYLNQTNTGRTEPAITYLSDNYMTLSSTTSDGTYKLYDLLDNEGKNPLTVRFSSKSRVSTISGKLLKDRLFLLTSIAASDERKVKYFIDVEKCLSYGKDDPFVVTYSGDTAVVNENMVQYKLRYGYAQAIQEGVYEKPSVFHSNEYSVITNSIFFGGLDIIINRNPGKLTDPLLQTGK
jgi:hypothetical protein